MNLQTKYFIAVATLVNVGVCEVKSFLSSSPPQYNVVKPGTTTAAEMEAALTNLMRGGSAFSATPMGDSVRQIDDLVQKEMIPKVFAAKNSDQMELMHLEEELEKCGEIVTTGSEASAKPFASFQRESKLHKECRADEAVKLSEKRTCLAQQKSLYEIKHLRCKHFASVSKEYGTSNNNAIIVKKGGSESVQTYITRLSTTFCGNHVHGNRGLKKKTGGWGGGLEDGMLDRYLRAKDACEVATKNWVEKKKECKKRVYHFTRRKAECNAFQKSMDSESCKSAVIKKDACESYAECYTNKLEALINEDKKVHKDTTDRKAEFRGLERIGCLISAFADGRVTNEEVDVCRNRTVNTSVLDMDYPVPVPRKECHVSDLYPSTETYKKAEFAPLPVLAKGFMSAECSGIKEISITPAAGSPDTCKCRRVTLNGYYSAGPLVKCSDCLDVYKSTQQNSCPQGTKIFSPATKEDWETFMESAGPLKDPHWIVDVTRSKDGCAGCKRYAMNSEVRQQSSWHTSDGSPWWLRSTPTSQPTGNYKANCYMNLGYRDWTDVDKIKFNDNKCDYHSRSYYCQLKALDLKPKKGSPRSCKCTKVDLTGPYSAEHLIKCEHCLMVSKSTQKNSCPKGTKIFSPASAEDWRTFLNSAAPLRAPNFIIDVTRPQNGCGGCGRYPMSSSTPQQATWRTSDGSPWWLRSTKYSEPSGNYKANCYMDLINTPHSSEDEIWFNDKGCENKASSYYCQTIKPKPEGLLGDLAVMGEILG
jgi:hypothetical protein